MKKVLLVLLLLLSHALGKSWNCQIMPAEHKSELDPISGAKIIFVTTNPANDMNLYFHDRCWLFDNEMMLFVSDRSKRQEIYGYLTKTGEIVRLNQEADVAAGAPLASKLGDRLYAVKEKAIFEWKLKLQQTGKTNVTVEERKICDFPAGTAQLSGLNENSDQTLISFGYKMGEDNYIAVAEIATGKQEVVAKVDFPIQHIQFHWNRPDVLSFARGYGNDTAPLTEGEPAHARIWFVNLHSKTPVPAFFQRPGELATHECWWVNDQMTFIGGSNPEEAHLKVIDLKTGEIRIIGAGAWWEGADAKEISKYNWWHGSGGPDGKWVAGDNWHGIIALFNAKTTVKRILTSGHRTYGKGGHPHVGWDLKGESVEFTSNKYGNTDVCIAVVPKEWTSR